MSRGVKILIFCIFLSNYQLNAQNNQIKNLFKVGDSLVRESKLDKAKEIYIDALVLAKRQKNETGILNSYKKLGTLFWLKKEYLISEKYYKKSLEIDSTSLISAYCFNAIALLKRKQHLTDSTNYYLEKALILYENQQTKEAYNVFLNAGIIYKNQQSFQKALNALLKAYNGYNETQNFKRLATVSNAIAQIQKDLGNNTKALKYYFEALSYREKISDTLGMLMSHNNIANAYKTQKEYDVALVHYNKALQFSKKKNNKLASILYNIGTVYYLKKDLINAKSYYIKALELNTKNNNLQSMFYNSNELALLCIESNDLLLAKKYLSKANSLIDKIENNAVINRNHEINAKYNLKIGNYKKAYDFQKKYSDNYKSTFNAKQTKIVQELQERFDSEKKQNENLRLSMLNQRNDSLINEQNSNIKIKNLLLIMSLLALLLLFIAYLFLVQRQKNLKQKRAVEKLKANYNGQELIKKIISKDLHDIIATNLDGIRLKVETLNYINDSKKSEAINEITNNINDINHQTRLISHRLSPLQDKLKKFNLLEIIINQLSEFQIYRGIQIHIKDTIPNVLNDMTLDAQTNFYGILLEILNNIEQHSNATSVTISNNLNSLNVFNFHIIDNGIGYKESKTDGIGIINIQQRAKLLGGYCVIQPSKVGTEFKLSFPLNKHLYEK
ncbi:Sensor histidine kinase ComP [Kordia antarctica]|uniref:histidine kinase n=1 Tax=Kordia antarctica TaxID=1218801 RepID=A0A7L4ZJM3_9FLAO|nr:tetratricopeptide repeat protein [Kordia antarctica]QHI36406.1 Sensor histidine kinase ComP [Kordia antarctica]